MDAEMEKVDAEDAKNMEKADAEDKAMSDDEEAKMEVEMRKMFSDVRSQLRKEIMIDMQKSMKVVLEKPLLGKKSTAVEVGKKFRRNLTVTQAKEKENRESEEEAKKIIAAVRSIQAPPDMALAETSKLQLHKVEIDEDELKDRAAKAARQAALDVGASPEAAEKEASKAAMQEEAHS